MSKRLDYIDAAKALALVLVIIAHGMSSDAVGMCFLGIVYSFHMPLFFICSGMTFRESSNFDEWKINSIRSIKTLYCPALILFLVKTLYENVYCNQIYGWAQIVSAIRSMIWASGVNINVGGGRLHLNRNDVVFSNILFRENSI